MAARRLVLTIALVASTLAAAPTTATAAGATGLIAFRSDVAGSYDLYVIRADGSGLRAILSRPAAESRPTWSPDGRHLAFQANYDGDFDIWGLDAAGVVRRLAGGGADDGANETQPAWSPDGSMVAYASSVFGAYEVFAEPIDGSEAPVNVSRDPANDRAPAWSPDGQRIAFGSDRTGDYDVWSAGADGADPLDLTSSPYHDAQPAWSPDGERIAFASDAGGTMGIWTMTAAGDDRTALSPDGAAESSPVWAPDGSAIAFEHWSAGTEHDVWLMDPTGADRRTLIDLGDDARPDWQPSDARGNVPPAAWITAPEDGASLSPGDAGRVRGATGTVAEPVARVEVAIRATMDDGSCRWWDGGAFAAGACDDPGWWAVEGTEAWEAIVPGGLPTTGPGDPYRSYRILARAIDRRWNEGDAAPVDLRVDADAPARTTGTEPGAIAFWSDRGGDRSLYLTTADGSGAVRLTGEEDDESYPAWSPDGRAIAFQSDRAGSWDLYVMDAAGRAVRLTHDDEADETQPAWSPDGRWIAYASNAPGNWDVFVTDVATGSTVTDVTVDPAVDRGATWSPAGDRVAFTSDRAGSYDVYTVAPDGTGLRRLTDDPSTDSHPAWSPGGTFLWFDSGRSGRRELWRMSAGGDGERRITTTADLDEYAASFSPDGRSAALEAFRDGNWDLYRVDPGGGGLDRLTGSAAIDQRAAWQPLRAPADRTAPSSRIRRPVDGDAVDGATLTSLVVASRDDSTVARVQIALRAIGRDGTCGWWSGDAVVPGPCREVRWLDGRRTSDVRWVLRLRSRLPPTGAGTPYRGYVLLVRGVDEWWNVETASDPGRNRIRFQVI